MGKAGSVVYYVEDDKNIRELTVYALGQGGIEARGCADDAEFRRACAERTPDAVLLDIMLPDTDGLKILARLRRTPGLSHVPVMMLTAKDSEYDKVLGLDSGADDYIPKPFRMMELLSRIRALLRRAQIVNERRITIGDVCLDYDSLTVSRGNESQTLPRKEFYLLYKLLSYPGKIFTRIQLMDEIWGMESQSDDNTINVHINRLRKRFEDYPEFTIETIRGLGYKAVKNL